MPILAFLVPWLIRRGVSEGVARWLSPLILVLALVLLLVGLWLGGVLGFHLIQTSDNAAVKAKAEAAVQQKWDADKIRRQAAVIRLQARIRDLESTMGAARAKAAKDRADAQAHTDFLSRHLWDSLRNRADRPAGLPAGAASTAVGEQAGICTGAGLYKRDAEFLVRLAADADTLRHALAECYAAVDGAVKATAGP